MPDVDISITTRELARMIKKAGIRFLDSLTKSLTRLCLWNRRSRYLRRYGHV